MHSENIVKTGTTVFAFKFKDGIIVAGDRQSTLGNYITETTTKLNQITKNIVMCAAGTAADMLYIYKVLVYRAKEYKAITHTEISCTTLANMLSILLSKRVFEVGIILSGYDLFESKIYYFDSIGFFDEHNIAVSGSGSYFARGKLEDITHHEDEKTAIELAKKVIQISKNLDAYTGFGTTICIIKPESCKFI